MRNVESHLLEDKMDEAVTHYINSHPSPESVHVDANSLALNVQDDAGGRVVTVMHPQNFPSQMCRQVSVVEGPWEDLLDQESRLAALVAHLAEHSRSTHHLTHTHNNKVPAVRSDVDTSVILDTPMRLFNGQTLDDTQILEQDSQVLDIGPGASPAQKQQSKKSLPHKKRISRKLKRTNGSSTPQQDIVVINCSEEVQQEEILPDNFVSAVQHQEHLPEETHHIAHEMRALFICQLCGEFYGDEQLKFYQHLRQHYEPHAIILENPVPDLAIDKMTNTCIVDNVQTLPDSIVELSLENTVPKTMYQPIDKHILYTSSDKTLNYNNKVYQTIEKEPESDKSDIYRVDLDKLDMCFCAKCNKTFKKQKQYEAHLNEAHSNAKLDDMNEFSEPEDLMEGIHVAVEGEADAEYTLLPHLTVENGQVHQEHVRQWYLRNAAGAEVLCACGGGGLCAACRPPSPPSPPAPRAPPAPAPAPAPRTPDQKVETLERIFEPEPQETPTFTEPPPPENTDIRVKVEPGTEPKADKKKPKTFVCTQCDRMFSHRNSLLYHMLMHSEKQEVCQECGKRFYTVSALKVHKRVHNGDRPCKCDECGRDFRQWSDLKYHKASIHSDQKQYKCEFCGKEFARRYSLNVHRRIHTGERNYKCDYCSKTFRASSYRLSHMRTHTGSKPYKCTQCDKSFRVTYDLRRHMLIHDKVRTGDDLKKTKEIKEAKEKKPKEPKEPKKVETKKVEPKTVEPKTVELKTVEPKTVEFKTVEFKIDEFKTVEPKTVEFIPEKPPLEERKGDACRVPILKSLLDKKQAKMTHRKLPKKPPNVTIQNFKMVDDYDVLGRQDEYKFKEVYIHKDSYPDEISQNDRDLELRSVKNQDEIESRLVYRGNTDGKMHVYTEIEKSKEYDGPIVTNTVSLTDLKGLDKDVRDARTDLHGESIENGFFERLSAFYNIPAV